MTWTETFAFGRRVRLLTQQCRPFWFYLLFFGGGLVALFGVAGLVAYVWHGTTELWPLFWMGLGLGLLLGVTTYFGSEWVPAVIRLNDKGVERQVMRGINAYLERWTWTDIAHCRIERAEDAGRAFDILAVYSHNGQVVPLGLRRKVTPEKLQEWFETHNHPFQQLPATEFTPLPIRRQSVPAKRDGGGKPGRIETTPGRKSGERILSSETIAVEIDDRPRN